METSEGISTRGELHPEEAALLLRLKVFVAARWMVAFGVAGATLVSTKLLGIRFDVVPVYLVCIGIAIYNGWLYFQTRSLARLSGSVLVQRVRALGNLHVFLDQIALILVLHFAGGLENPLLFYYVLHVIMASILLHYQVVYLMATTAFLLAAGMGILEFTGLIPHHNMEGLLSGELYRQGTYVATVLGTLAIILYSSGYMVSAISGELRKRQRQVVELSQQRLEQTRIELAKLGEERVRFLKFLSMVAHDLKAPLAAIQSYNEAMLGGYTGELTDKQRNMLERSKRRIEGEFTLISNLLDISRVETGQIVQEMKMTPLEQVIENSLDAVRDRAKQKEIQLDVSIPAELPQIYVSPTRLQQVLTNLLDNAVKFTPNGGRISLAVVVQEEDIQFAVADNGIGILPDDMPKLFGDFFRGSNVDSAGTGLGLSISKRIVQAHGGRIWAESPCPETGCGTKFTFTVPRRKAPQGAGDVGKEGNESRD